MAHARKNRLSQLVFQIFDLNIVSMTRILRPSSSFRNRARKSYSFFTEYAGNSVCVFEVPCFNSAHAARVCAKLSAKFRIPLEYAL